jgi:hypothetical protein
MNNSGYKQLLEPIEPITRVPSKKMLKKFAGMKKNAYLCTRKSGYCAGYRLSIR